MGFESLQADVTAALDWFLCGDVMVEYSSRMCSLDIKKNKLPVNDFTFKMNKVYEQKAYKTP